jgi:hypothetical protein
LVSSFSFEIGDNKRSSRTDIEIEDFLVNEQMEHMEKIIKLDNGGELHEDNIGKYWYLDNKLHRVEGPAIEFINGSTAWYSHGKYHRIDGPAIEIIYTKEWWCRGFRHRFDGPAVEWNDGRKEWWYQGKYINCQSQQEFERLIKLKVFW